ncbi:hypothetical protein BJX70DRAFT_380427 [Aspergillus crustosus]
MSLQTLPVEILYEILSSIRPSWQLTPSEFRKRVPAGLFRFLDLRRLGKKFDYLVLRILVGEIRSHECSPWCLVHRKAPTPATLAMTPRLLRLLVDNRPHYSPPPTRPIPYYGYYCSGSGVCCQMTFTGW